MADREHLHALVDSLPEGALESAQTYLQAIQIWPPKEPEYPPEVEQHRKELEAKRDKFLKRPAGGTWAIGKNKSHWVVLTARQEMSYWDKPKSVNTGQRPN